MDEQKADPPSIVNQIFRFFGQLSSRFPVEILVIWLTAFSCFLTLGLCGHSLLPDFKNFDSGKDEGLYETLIFGTTSYILALSYIYFRCKQLLNEKSYALVGMTILHNFVSSLIFFSALLALFGKDWRHIREALPFCILLIDIKKVNVIEKLALSSTSLEEVHEQIAKGSSLIGPTLTLNTIVETLVIQIGTHSGVKSIEVLCVFGVVAVIVNYLVSMTFIPAALSLYYELHHGDNEKPSKKPLIEETPRHIANPVVEQVKIIMSVGLAMIHVHLHLASVKQKRDSQFGQSPSETTLQSVFGLLHMSTEQVITISLALLLATKYIFENNDMTAKKVQRQQQVSEDHHSELPCAEDSCTTKATSTGISESVDGVIIAGSKALMNIGKEIQENVVSFVNSASQSIITPDATLDDYTDGDILTQIDAKRVALHQLDNKLKDKTRAVKLRRHVLTKKIKRNHQLTHLPYENYDYSKVIGACCENVIGYMPIPVGVAGPLLLDGRVFYVPMATVEGCLVASTNRGCRALVESNGVRSRVLADGMTRGPAVRFPSALQASDVKEWLEDTDHFNEVKKEFDSTSRFARLQKIQCAIAGRLLYLRFKATTGDAMGMNMISKGTERALEYLHVHFPEMEIISISGNYCTDKKSAAVNWIEGRGKSVVCEAIIPASVVTKVLKTTTDHLVDVNVNKNLVGSAIAGALGGFNAHAANIVTAVFLATGQDAAQNIGSSQCMTLMEKCGPTHEDLYMSCTMPSVEVGTVGGGTILPPQQACLKMLGIDGAHHSKPGENASQLARIIVASVMAGELSLLSALAAGHLVKSHLKHNRSSINLSKLVKNCPMP